MRQVQGRPPLGTSSSPSLCAMLLGTHQKGAAPRIVRRGGVPPEMGLGRTFSQRLHFKIVAVQVVQLNVQLWRRHGARVRLRWSSGA